MVGQKIDGIEVSNSVKEILKRAVENLKSNGIEPCLATILVGDNPASAVYVRNKHKASDSIGIKTKDHKLPSETTQDELNHMIDDLNRNDEVHGILVQLPLPNHLDEFATTSRISPLKDVDGLTPQNVGLLSIGKSILRPCTPSGIMEMFYYYKINLEGKKVVLINRSNLIGKPLYHLLLQNNATVITCHSKTTNLNELCQNADIVITAVGDRTKFKLTSDMIKQDAIVIDVAIFRHEGKLVGDSDYDDIIQKASWVTPVPGGVGPMTVAMLLKNTITAASLQREIVS
jgi:methylenetetrahydrofolate dehydrogenase (NADP+)/methenyltetrahydrofolate cyclohydrolase